MGQRALIMNIIDFSFQNTENKTFVDLHACHARTTSKNEHAKHVISSKGFCKRNMFFPLSFGKLYKESGASLNAFKKEATEEKF